MKKLFSATLFAIPALCLAQAKNSEYSNASDETSFFKFQPHGQDTHVNAIGLFGSVGFADEVLVLSSAADFESDGELLVEKFASFSDQIELTGFSFGAGLHMPLDEKIDVVTSFAFLEHAVEFSSISEEIDLDGYGLSAGIKAMIHPKIEVNASLMYTDIESKTQTDFSAGIEAYLSPKLGLGAFYETGEDGESMFLDANFYFR